MMKTSLRRVSELEYQMDTARIEEVTKNDLDTSGLNVKFEVGDQKSKLFCITVEI
jgi:hypothetical protein